MRPVFHYALAAAGLLISGSVAQAANLIGNTFGTGGTASLYDVNTTTGAATGPRSAGVGNLVGVRFGPDGNLYGLTTFNTGGVLGQGNSLYRFNPVTGAPTLIGATGLGNIFEGDLDFNPTTGLLYGMQDVPGAYRIFRINTANGAASNIVNVSNYSPLDLSAMAFSPGGTLFMIDTSAERLITINPDTGVVATNVGLSTPLGGVAGMAFDSGVCYVADGELDGTNRLYTLNTATGQLTLVGNLNVSVGLAGLTAIPEPASLLSASAASAAILLMRRRSR